MYLRLFCVAVLAAALLPLAAQTPAPSSDLAPVYAQAIPTGVTAMTAMALDLLK